MTRISLRRCALLACSGLLVAATALPAAADRIPATPTALRDLPVFRRGRRSAKEEKKHEPQPYDKPARRFPNDPQSQTTEGLPKFPVATRSVFESLSEVTAGHAPAAPTLNPALVARRDRIRRVLAHYRPRVLNTRDRGPWEVMHALLAGGVQTQLRVGGPEGEPVSAAAWLGHNRTCRDMRLFNPDARGIQSFIAAGVQGHEGQFLAMMAQIRAPSDYPLQIADRSYTLRDLIEYEKAGCRPKSELTFKLISLSHYLEPDARWRSSDGQTWTIERLMREEIAQPIKGVACGGTHRLMGISYALQRRNQLGLTNDRYYAHAQRFLRGYQEYAFRMQNRDGSLSTNWFEGPEAKPDVNRRVQTTGHILEWLVFSQRQEQLTQTRTVRAVDYLTQLLVQHRYRDWPVGPLGHAVRALSLYDERVFGPFDGPSQAATPAEGESQDAAPADVVKSPPAPAKVLNTPPASARVVNPPAAPARVVNPPAAPADVAIGSRPVPLPTSTPRQATRGTAPPR